ncbi:MAG: Uma2 family endonuclease, partial [bacterium]|nr:Uma2 family endonuclease [bacterium]
MEFYPGKGYLFDPFGEYLEPRLQGFRLMAGRYRPMRPARDGALISRVVGLNLSVEEDHLRLRDTRTGERLLRIEEVQRARRESEERARKAEERAESEAAERRALEAEL